jgi:hypothetical protein
MAAEKFKPGDIVTLKGEEDEWEVESLAADGKQVMLRGVLDSQPHGYALAERLVLSRHGKGDKGEDEAKDKHKAEHGKAEAPGHKGEHAKAGK